MTACATPHQKAEGVRGHDYKTLRQQTPPRQQSVKLDHLEEANGARARDTEQHVDEAGAHLLGAVVDEVGCKVRAMGNVKVFRVDKNPNDMKIRFWAYDIEASVRMCSIRLGNVRVCSVDIKS